MVTFQGEALPFLGNTMVRPCLSWLWARKVAFSSMEGLPGGRSTLYPMISVGCEHPELKFWRGLTFEPRDVHKLETMFKVRKMPLYKIIPMSLENRSDLYDLNTISNVTM